MTVPNRNLTKLHRLLESVGKKGIRNSFLIAFSYVVDRYFDFKYSTDTCSWVTLDQLGVDASRREHSVMYQPTHAIPLRKLLCKLDIPREKVLVDLGCGKGRVQLVAAELEFRESRGIELSPYLCYLAQQNFAVFRAKTQSTSNLVIVNSDVVDYEIRDDEEVFFLFNPFDCFILEKFMQNLTKSLQKRNRKIWIIYRNAIFREFIEKNVPVSTVKEFLIWGQDFVVFEVELNAALFGDAG